MAFDAYWTEKIDSRKSNISAVHEIIASAYKPSVSIWKMAKLREISMGA